MFRCPPSGYPPTMPKRAAVAHELTERLGEVEAVDAVATPLGKQVRSLLSAPKLKDLLGGTWLGHAVHPLLTDVVIGTWMSAAILDFAGGEDAEGGADRLVAAGVAAYPVVALTGVHDWADGELGDASVRRVGLVHAASNGLGVALQLASLAARRRGARGQGVALSMAAMGAVGLGGYLGGHLSYARGQGVDQTVFDAGPEEWTFAGSGGELPEGESVAVDVDGTPVLLVRQGGAVRALHDRCSHRGCSLAEGRIDGDVVECPCHGSRFRLADGGIERGPATSPQPAFETRETGGRIELRRTS